MNIALVAHDKKKDDLIVLIKTYAHILKKHQLFARSLDPLVALWLFLVKCLMVVFRWPKLRGLADLGHDGLLIITRLG